MTLEIGSLSHNSLVPFGPWQCHNHPCDRCAGLTFQSDIFASLGPAAKTVACCSAINDEKPTTGGSCASRSATLLVPRASLTAIASTSSSPIRPPSHAALPTSSPAAQQLEQPESALPIRFSLTTMSFPSSFSFENSSILPATMKRCRPKSDVDGFNTAALSCKKRRLRLQLITSRLSQPFSLPATHIIIRDAIASGDKRFIKMASVADPHKRIPTFSGSVLQRAAVLNRVRLRVHHEAAEKGHAALAIAAGNAAVLHNGLQLVTGARFLSPSALSAPNGSHNSSSVGQSARNAANPQVQTQTGSPTSPYPSNLRAVEAVNLRASTSPRLRPSRSPLLLPVEVALDDIDDGEVAFPTSEHESRYDSLDDPEHVYSDFGAIFGGPSDNTESDEEDHSVEEYLDELDGISWVAR